MKSPYTMENIPEITKSPWGKINGNRESINRGVPKVGIT